MIILSIPYLSTDFVKKNIPRSGFDLLEFRLDYLKELSAFDKDLMNRQTIITIRNKKEGGINFFDEAQKLNLYRYAQEKGCLIDCELSFYKKYKDKLHNENIILSYHDFSENTDMEAIKKILSYSDKVKYIKLALTVNKWKQLREITNLISDYKNVIFVSMGITGIVSRLIYKKIGSAATYFGLDKFYTAQGQISLSNLWFDPRKANKNTLIGGLLGGKQVYASRGLDFYNKYFKEHKINAIYLPFYAEDVMDFYDWYSGKKHYGLSVTMPFKEDIAKLFDVSGVYNLLVENKLYNTDEIALRKAALFLNLKKNDSVLIYGSGAMAKLALSLFSNMKLYIFARNKTKAEELAIKYNATFFKPEKVDLLINCTPSGLKEDFFATSKINTAFSSLIDLPYSTKQDTMLVQYAKKNKIPYVDGNMFWHWQAEGQLNLFLQAINNAKR